jgi:hypothetical protein
LKKESSADHRRIFDTIVQIEGLCRVQRNRSFRTIHPHSSPTTTCIPGPTANGNDETQNWASDKCIFLQGGVQPSRDSQYVNIAMVFQSTKLKKTKRFRRLKYAGPVSRIAKAVLKAMRAWSKEIEANVHPRPSKHFIVL